MNIREDLPEEEPPAADGRKKKNGKKDKKVGGYSSARSRMRIMVKYCG